MAETLCLLDYVPADRITVFDLARSDFNVTEEMEPVLETLQRSGIELIACWGIDPDGFNIVANGVILGGVFIHEQNWFEELKQKLSNLASDTVLLKAVAA